LSAKKLHADRAAIGGVFAAACSADQEVALIFGFVSKCNDATVQILGGRACNRASVKRVAPGLGVKPFLQAGCIHVPWGVR
jgi:hypothetical protein